MIKRLISLLFLAWVLGFAWFALLLPLPAAPQKTDGIVVLTGGPGRIDRALERLEAGDAKRLRSEEHTSELQSLMRISYAVFCLKKKKNTTTNIATIQMNKEKQYYKTTRIRKSN